MLLQTSIINDQDTTIGLCKNNIMKYHCYHQHIPGNYHDHRIETNRSLTSCRHLWHRIKTHRRTKIFSYYLMPDSYCNIGTAIAFNFCTPAVVIPLKNSWLKTLTHEELQDSTLRKLGFCKSFSPEEFQCRNLTLTQALQEHKMK